MQAMNNIEQQKQEQKLQVEAQITMKKFIENLEKGKKSANMMRSLIVQQNPSVKMKDSNQDYYKALDHHSMVCLDTYFTSLSILKGAAKRKQHHLDDDDEEEEEDVRSVNFSEESGDQDSSKMSIVNVRRRPNGNTREEEVTDLTDVHDGFAWRKYGQKFIRNCPHPRHYYRCTHKVEQNCQATKKVQQISDNPIKYRVIYNDNHTCNNNFFKGSSSFTIDDSPGDHPSAFVLKFDQANEVNPKLFPSSSAFPTTSVAIVNQNSPSVSSNHTSISQYTTAMTTEVVLSANPGSEQSNDDVSVADQNHHSSTATSPLNLEEEDYSRIMADFSDLFPPQFWKDLAS